MNKILVVVFFSILVCLFFHPVIASSTQQNIAVNYQQIVSGFSGTFSPSYTNHSLTIDASNLTVDVPQFDTWVFAEFTNSSGYGFAIGYGYLTAYSDHFMAIYDVQNWTYYYINSTSPAYPFMNVTTQYDGYVLQVNISSVPSFSRSYSDYTISNYEVFTSRGQSTFSPYVALFPHVDLGYAPAVRGSLLISISDYGVTGGTQPPPNPKLPTANDFWWVLLIAIIALIIVYMLSKRKEKH